MFNWSRPVPLVFVSEDGTSLPKPYAYPDILAASLGNVSYTHPRLLPSMEKRRPATSKTGVNLDLSKIGGDRGRWLYPGATTELGFANGTKVLIPFTGITSGDGLYELWFSTPSGTATSQNVAASNTTSTTSSAAASLTAAVSAAAASTPAL